MALDSTQSTTSALAGLDAPIPTAPAYVGPAAQPAPTFFGRLLQGALNGLAGGIQSGAENSAGVGTSGFTPRANGLAYAQQIQARQDQAKQQQQTDATQAAQQDFENRTKQYQAEQEATVQKAQAVQAKLGSIHLAQQIQGADQDRQDAYFKDQQRQIDTAQDNGAQVIATIPHVPLDGKTPQERGAAYIQQHPELMSDPHSQIKFTADGDGEIDIHVLKYDPNARASADEINRQLASVGSDRKVPAGSTMSAADAHSLVSQEAGLAANAHAESKKEEFKSALEAKRQMQLAQYNQEQENFRQSRTLAANGGSIDSNPLANSTPDAKGVRTDYLSSLPSGVQGQVKAIGEGRMAPPNARTKIGKELADQVATAYPNYDASKQPAYQKMRTDFVSGKTAQGLNALNTAVEHLGVMSDNASLKSTLPGISAIERASGDQEANNFKLSQHAATDEVGKAYKSGVLSESEYKEWKSDIDSWTPAGAKSKASALVGLLKGKIDSYQQQLDNGTPSGVPSGINLMNPAAQRTYARLSPSSAESKTPSGANSIPTAGPNEVVKRRPKPGGGYEYKVVPKP